MGCVAIPVVISGQFRENQSYSGTIGAKTDFRCPSGTQVTMEKTSVNFGTSKTQRNTFGFDQYISYMAIGSGQAVQANCLTTFCIYLFASYHHFCTWFNWNLNYRSLPCPSVVVF